MEGFLAQESHHTLPYNKKFLQDTNFAIFANKEHIAKLNVREFFVQKSNYFPTQKFVYIAHVMALHGYFLSNFSVPDKLVLAVTMGHRFYGSSGALLFVCSSHG